MSRIASQVFEFVVPFSFLICLIVRGHCPIASFLGPLMDPFDPSHPPMSCGRRRSIEGCGGVECLGGASRQICPRHCLAFDEIICYRSFRSLISFAIFFPTSYVLIMIAHAGATFKHLAAQPLNRPLKPCSWKICHRNRGMDLSSGRIDFVADWDSTSPE